MGRAARVGATTTSVRPPRRHRPAPDASVAQVGAAIGAARGAFDSGPWGRHEPRRACGCLTQLGEALLNTPTILRAVPGRVGLHRNERLMQVDGAGLCRMHAAELAAQLADEAVDRNERGGHVAVP